LQKIKRQVGDKSFIVFLADDIEPAISVLRDYGVDVLHPDRIHWNNNGHQIVRDLLSECTNRNY